MENPAFFFSAGAKTSEYLLVLDPQETLRHKIDKCREALIARYGIRQPPAGRPHVSLARFIAREEMEEKIQHRLQLIAMEEKPFVVELQDYGSYPMHAIFIRIANQPRVLELIRHLKEARRLMKAAGEDPYFIQDPNIALAGRLPREKYLEAMKEYLHKSFSGRFVADQFLLLKRSMPGSRYQVAGRFRFECLPAQTAQGTLFG